MSDVKTQVMEQIRHETALQNARFLVQKLNEHCFERCVPKPGSSLSSSETTCYTHCMEKYMAAWNTVSGTYLDQVRKNAPAGSGSAFGGL